MKNKILFSFFSLALVLGAVGFAGAQAAHAQVAPTFPTGCTSNLGYSTTNGSPCNGTGYATMNIPGCTNAVGYSVTTGKPCDGASSAIQYLAGCTSIYSYSNISGAPCNGTSVASVDPSSGVVVVTPGLPTTGAGGNAASNMILLASSLVVALLGSVYLVKKSRMAN